MAERKDIEKVLREIHSVDWSKFTGWEYYRPEEVPWRLTALIALEDQADVYDVANGVTYSIGNGHNGTYFDAIEKALDIIIFAALNGKTAASKSCALDILTHLYLSCCPYPGLYSPGKEQKLQDFLDRSVEAMRPTLLDMKASGFEAEDTVRYIDELLRWMPDEA